MRGPRDDENRAVAEAFLAALADLFLFLAFAPAPAPGADADADADAVLRTSTAQRPRGSSCVAVRISNTSRL